VPKSQISSKLQWATIDLEDHSFYSNIGVDFVGTIRAALSDVSGGATQGGSTITQQLVKNIVAKDSTQTLTRKLNEAILAYGVTQQFDKAQILEMYLNTIPYGDSNQGVEAAAKNYFGLQQSVDAKNEVVTANMKLSWAQAALLAGLPNAPTLYLPIQYSCSKAPCPQSKWDNPFQDPNAPCGPHIASFGPEWYLTHGHEWLDYCRAREALDAVAQYGVGDGSVSFTSADYAQADAELTDMLVHQTIYHWKAYNDAGTQQKNATSVKAPHFVDYVVQQMADNFGISDLGNAGLTIYTTLDLNLQNVAQQTIHHYIDESYHEPWYYPLDNDPLSVASNAHNGALVAIDQNSGDIMAMVGSADYYSKDPHVLGYNNITTSKLRSMGSSTKPLMYATAFQMGWNPGVMLQDIPICFPVPNPDPTYVDPAAPACKGWYVPHNYEENQFSGTIPLRRMLDGSLNIPATESMEFVGATPDTSDAFLSMAQRLGVTTLSKNRMGPTTTLGTQEIPLLQLTGAYATFANLGKRHAPRAILRIETGSGQQLYPVLPGPQVAQVGPGEQVLSPQAAYMMTNVLSDNFARTPFFKAYNPLHLDPDFPNLQIAAKTGTSSGTTGPNDIVTVGYSPMLTVGVWVGNTDANDPMTAGIIGIAGAGYVFHDVMDWAAKNYKWAPDASFPIPPGLASGTFNCNTGLAPYKDSTPADLDCVAHPAPGFSGVNPYDPDHGINHRPDTDIYIQGQIPQQS
jgi:membrane peptidoglycan carboxypeptidase